MMTRGHPEHHPRYPTALCKDIGMHKEKSRPKASRQHSSFSSENRPAGQNGISLIPPPYGIDFVDREQPVQRQAVPEVENRTGLPAQLKVGIEALSGHTMDDVRVHESSSKPAELQALAYTQGTDIYMGRGQERHLAHEAWHVVQQKQGRVRPTMQLRGSPLNDDRELEREAEIMGHRALQMTGTPNSALAGPGASAASRGAISDSSPSQRKVLQRVAGDPQNLAEERYAVVAAGQSITYGDLIGGCLAVTVTFQGGGGAGVHLALDEQSGTQWEDFRRAIAGQTITQIDLNCDMLGEDDGWRVKYDNVNYTPITALHRPMGTAALMRGLNKTQDELAPLGWWTMQFSDWFQQALGCQAYNHSEVTTNITKQF
jgi:hypothetical protein